MKTTPILTTLVVSVILSGAIAFTSGCKPAPVERTATERSVDEKLSEAVKAALGNSSSFRFPDVQVASFNGKVQLSGFVVSADQKQSAETLAKAVPGVESVENKISLKK
ncbi:MAG: BON domain-containing protein [Opitutus sp.]